MLRMKKILAVICSAVVLLCSVSCLVSAAEGAAFTPVFRFVAASDTHVRDDNDVNAERIGKMMSLAYSVADADPSYQNVDALLIAGDLTNDGTKTEFDKFSGAVRNALREGTQFLGVVAKNHDGYKMIRKEMRAYYSSVTGNDADFHSVIGGYHFIGVSASTRNTEHYDSGQLKWLRQQLNEAVADDPAKPVFVMHHEHVRDTVYGSSAFDGWGVTYFTNILKDYPQVVDFSGHSHYPLNDPRSIWQGAFTAVGTGAIYYAEFTVDKTRSYHPEGNGEVATCWIVETDARNRIRLRGYDINAGECLCEYILDDIANADARQYTPEQRKAASSAPEFDEGATISVTAEKARCSIVSPIAESTDGMPVVLYRAYAKDEHGTVAAESWTLPKYYQAGAQDSISLELNDLGAGEYTICVVAENAYGGRSEALETVVSVEGESAFKSFFKRIGLWFRRLFDAIKGLFS